jgi:hypothetical protein
MRPTVALALMLSVGLADATERSASAKSEFKRENRLGKGDNGFKRHQGQSTISLSIMARPVVYPQFILR